MVIRELIGRISVIFQYKIKAKILELLGPISLHLYSEYREGMSLYMDVYLVYTAVYKPSWTLEHLYIKF